MLLLLVVLTPGCKRAPEITAYEVPKPDVVWQANHVGTKGKPADTDSGAAVPRRILGAIIPRGDSLWFFKTEGESGQVSELLEPMIRIVKGLTFTGDNPKWSLPVGWTEQPGNAFRYATLVTTGKQEISVSKLPLGKDPLPDQILSNVNRWRGQVNLPPTDAEGLKADSVSFDLELGGEKLPVTFVNLEGTGGGAGRMGAAGGMSPPFARGAVAPPPAAAEKVNLKYELPAGWKPGAANGFSSLSFVVPDGEAAPEKALKVTVTELPAAANNLVENVNRWRGQAGLPPATPEEIEKTITKLPVLGGEATEVILTGQETAQGRTIHGIIALEGERMWFVKLDGPSPLAEREREAFRTFAKSLRKE